MPRVINISDHWVGYYLNSGAQWPIEADLVQSGERLTGTMRDVVTDKEYSVTELAREANLPPGGDERIVSRLRELFPDAPAHEIRYVTHLPPNSVLHGWVRGAEIYFLKSYAGTHYGGYQLGENLVGFQKAKHEVHYGGQLSSDGQEIAGKWWIEDTHESGRKTAEGLFRLRREEGAGGGS